MSHPDDQFDLRHIISKNLDKTLADRKDAFTRLLTVQAEGIVWMGVSGALLLALRHPAFVGPTRDNVEHFTRLLTGLLIEQGCLTEDEADDMWRSEHAIRDGIRAEAAGEGVIVAAGEIVCIRCACTDRKPCPNWCHWVRVDREAGVGVCSNCAEE